MILLGASTWGTLGAFAIPLYSAGLKPLDVAAVRVTVAGACFAAMTILFRREHVRITRGQFGWLVLHGMIAVGLYNILFFIAMEKIGIALAFALLYSAPAWSAILGYILLHERHPPQVYVAVLLTIIGVALVVIQPSGLNLIMSISTTGLLTGLGAAITYALFSIMGKPLLRDCPSSTLLLYSFGVGSFVLTLFDGFDGGAHRLQSISTVDWFILLGIGVIPTFLAYLAYTEGLRHTPVTRATILAAIEPVVAVVLGLVVFHEHLSLYQYVGIFLILSATVVVAASRAKTRATSRNPIVVDTCYVPLDDADTSLPERLSGE
ncbi:EamA family transporter [Acidithiobacillus sp.]|uniref:DMT family transporter n=1 Tax=Acidithiobacillus sp. TaxID=1872118 RepID=UPI002589062B|nr:EamA family transporter [Acidithiobacillus sp.]MDD5375550.1 EamA family transporter [Acidithiobacillus sp.]